MFDVSLDSKLPPSKSGMPNSRDSFIMVKTTTPVFEQFMGAKRMKWSEVYKENFKNRPEGAVCLRVARYKNSLSQRDLSKKSKIPITTISKYENGERKISITQAKKLAKTLKTNYKVFLHKK